MTPRQTVNYLFDGFSFSKLVKSHRDTKPVQPQGVIGTMLRIGSEVLVYAIIKTSGEKVIMCQVDAVNTEQLDQILDAGGEFSERLRRDTDEFNKETARILTADFRRSGKSQADYLATFGSEVDSRDADIMSTEVPLETFLEKYSIIKGSNDT